MYGNKKEALFGLFVFIFVSFFFQCNCCQEILIV
nr:MAG TPA: chitin synthase regulator [Caudoviricetes sp.]